MSVFKPTPKSTDQILSGMNALLRELEASGAQNTQLKEKKEQEQERLRLESQEIEAELKRNAAVTAKFRDLLA